MYESIAMLQQNDVLWGLDLGGTKVEGIIVNRHQPEQVYYRYRLPTEASKGYLHILGQIDRLVRHMSDKTGNRPSKIGIGTPGTLDPSTQLLKNSNSVALNGKSLKADLEQMLGIEVRMANDANCFALAETRLGVVRKHFPAAHVVFGVIMGTGVGGGIVVDGKVIQGLQGIAGEWGHNFLDDSGGECYCGRRGCVETVLSGPALEKYYTSVSGQKKSLPEICQLSDNQSDMQAMATLERLIQFFGKALGVVVNILDPDVIVIGGGVGNIPLIYSRGVDVLRQYVFNNRLETPVVPPLLGDSAGVFGAALLTAE